MEKLTDIPEVIVFNDKYNNLLNKLKEEGAYFFIGAGFSRLYGYPSWRVLVDKIVDYFWNHKDQIKEEDQNKLTLSSIENFKNSSKYAYILDYLSSINTELFEEAIKVHLSINTEPEYKKRIGFITKLHSHTIGNIPKFKLLTTNLDTSIEDICKLESSKIEYKPEYFKVNPATRLYYLHGNIEKESKYWIVRQRDYLEKYLDPESPINIFLREIFQSKTVVFVGYGLEEYQILDSIARLGKSSKIHYAFKPVYEGNIHIIEYEEKILSDYYNIRFLKYKIEEKGWNVLIDNFKSLVDQCTQMPPIEEGSNDK